MKWISDLELTRGEKDILVSLLCFAETDIAPTMKNVEDFSIDFVREVLKDRQLLLNTLPMICVGQQRWTNAINLLVKIFEIIFTQSRKQAKMKPKWWLAKIKPFVETEVWYCPDCGDLTEVEINSVLITCAVDTHAFFGNGNRPSWFARCWECKTKHFQPYEFSCPTCGFLCGDEKYIIEYGEPVFNISKSMEFGGSPIDWEETAKCPMCNTTFSFINSNC